MPDNVNALENRLVEAWKKHHSMNGFVDRKKDDLGLDVVGVTGMPLAYNVFLHRLNVISVRRMLKGYASLEGKRVLDIGCGTGRWSQYFHGLGARVTGIDVSRDLLEDNKKRIQGIEFLEMSACRLDFPDNTFDLVNSVTVLQHIPYEIQAKALDEICRVLKPGGSALIVEGTREDETLVYKYSFPHSTRGWIAQFTSRSFRLIRHEKNTNPFLLNSYFSMRDRALKSIKQSLGEKTADLSDPLDTSSYDAISRDRKYGEAHKKHLAARKLYRVCNNGCIVFLTWLSYPVEYANSLLFKYYPTSNGAFLFRKEEK